MLSLSFLLLRVLFLKSAYHRNRTMHTKTGIIKTHPPANRISRPRATPTVGFRFGSSTIQQVRDWCPEFMKGTARRNEKRESAREKRQSQKETSRLLRGCCKEGVGWPGGCRHDLIAFAFSSEGSHSLLTSSSVVLFYRSPAESRAKRKKPKPLSREGCACACTTEKIFSRRD